MTEQAQTAASQPADRGTDPRALMAQPPAAPAPELDAVDLTDPQLYLNRELSLVQFHRRVLAQASDESMPLLERLRFLTIVSSILDEFYEVRVAGLLQGVVLDVAHRGPDGRPPSQVLAEIADEVHELVDTQYRLLNEVMLPALAQEGIRLLRRNQLTAAQRQWVETYFEEQALPVLTPLGLDLAHPFPNVQNKGLNFIVSLEGRDAFGRDAELAVVQVPRCLPRLIKLPEELSDTPHCFVMISSVIHENIGKLFPGMRITGCHQFRVTRNSDLWVDEEESDDLLRALKTELPRRHYGDAVRLEVADNCNERKTALLLAQFGLSTQQLFQVHGPVNLHRLAALYGMVDRDDLKFGAFVPGRPPNLPPKADIFRVLADGDVLLHHPFQGFGPVLELLHQAAADPKVLAVKMTLYRTGVDSPVTDALVEAAQAGKAVTAVVELRARFDEAANIRLATRLQSAGANVVYGVVGYKAHAKMLMVVRREEDGLRRYVHLGTGNYHPITARFYTDLGLMTCDPAVGRDLHRVFSQLTGLRHAAKLEKVLQSPFSLADEVIRCIDAEAEAARAGKPSGVMAKLNAVIDPAVIQALYRASQAGVPIRLYVRGVCRLRPGIPGVSESIRVFSTVGRFLEHTRVYRFHAGGEDKVYLSSADWMERNLYRRVETAFPIEAAELKKRVVEEIFELYIKDRARTWELHADGRYRLREDGEAGFSAQDALLEMLTK
jgi:polyphosphate kinase